MNIKITPNNLTKLEKIFEDAKYLLRFEKGSFTSGYCILEDKKVVVINKFLNLEGRINTLLDILSTLPLNEELLTAESHKLYRQILNSKPAQDAGEAAGAGEQASEN
ncbi:hypothetical protein HF324_22460 [Chitinophaga oryzae]|uniref:Uncharacterized protein n=1 Tax=Chitinophaga oryzae TaxID=2725414 RepID=A0AAE6ZJK2_9BACT|nr:hypothetical protein [Chitinophaga oryzae]QJB33922.1 hypothetical protein HF329_22565 [Chitinophaga oryzae]QJB40451.1 hypothetical protein HF324_22460 [Chitinophaga oryzae]